MNMRIHGVPMFAVLLLLAAGIPVHGAPGTVESWITTTDMQYTLTPQPSISMEEKSDPDGSVLRLDPVNTYQTILGLGASLEHTTCANLWRLSPEHRNEVIERLVSPEKGIGMNLMRICIGTPDFTGEPWYSYDDMPPGEKDPKLEHFSIDKDRAYILPLLKAVRAANPDLRFFASPWSPPGWMKTGDDLIGGHLYPRYYRGYANYFVKFIQAYEAEGIPIHAITVQNEPGVNKRDDVRSWWYPSCQWSLVEDEDTWWPVSHEIMGLPERDFIRDHLGPAFAEAAIGTKIWCYDHNFNNLWYPQNILRDPEAAKYVDGVAFHPYGGNPSAMEAIGREFPDKGVFLTEGSTFGLKGAADIMAYLRNGARSYNAWVTIIDSHGKPNNGPFDATETCITLDANTLEVQYNFDYYMYGHFMKFIQQGAVCIDSTAGAPQVERIAFKNPDGSLVLVTTNPAASVQTLLVAVGAQGFRASLPPHSVTTFRWPSVGESARQ